MLALCQHRSCPTDFPEAGHCSVQTDEPALAYTNHREISDPSDVVDVVVAMKRTAHP